MTKHYVTFYSPGTFVSESTTKEIKKWDVATAKRMARKIKERYGATPYGFQFTTRYRGPKSFDSRQVKQSGMYYLGGKVETLAEVKARVKKEGSEEQNKILISNMEINKIKRIITNDNSWRFTAELGEDDKVLSWKNE